MDLGETTKQYQEVMEQIQAKYDKYMGYINKLIEEMNNLKQAAQDIAMQQLNNLKNKAKDKTENSNASQKANEYADKIKGSIAHSKQYIEDKKAWLMKKIETCKKKVMDWLKESQEQVKKWFGKIKEAIQKQLEEMAKQLLKALAAF